jgi:hypothetical protein
METINRIAVTISFKQKFFDWVNQLPDKGDLTWTLEMLNEDKSVYLVPEFSSMVWDLVADEPIEHEEL